MFQFDVVIWEAQALKLLMAVWATHVFTSANRHTHGLEITSNSNYWITQVGCQFCFFCVTRALSQKLWSNCVFWLCQVRCLHCARWDTSTQQPICIKNISPNMFSFLCWIFGFWMSSNNHCENERATEDEALWESGNVNDTFVSSLLTAREHLQRQEDDVRGHLQPAACWSNNHFCNFNVYQT